MLDTTIEAAGHIIEASLRIDEWDEMPMLVVVLDNGHAGIIALAGDAEVPDQIPALVDPIKRQADGTKVIGLVLSTEAWSLSAKFTETDDEATKEAAQNALQIEVFKLQLEGKRFSDHPDAVEVKTFALVDATGIEFRSIYRGSAEVRTQEGTMTGRVPDALKALLAEVNA